LSIIKLVELLKKSGYKPAIITRGYGGEATEWPQYVQANSNPNIVGDEAVLMAKRTFVPVYAGANRLASIDQLLKAHPCDVIISDDGMQHYKLPRDIQIAVIDAQRQLGNGYCLPAGPLREKKERLKTCDFIVVNGGFSTDLSILNQDVESYCTNMNLSGKTLINLSSNKEKPISDFTGKKVQALTGIGNPQRFYLTLRKHDIHVTENSFPDHHAFTQDDLAFDRDELILMTEKDAVKCQSLIKDSNAYWYLPVSADLSEEFETKIIEALDRVSVKSNAK